MSWESDDAKESIGNVLGVEVTEGLSKIAEDAPILAHYLQTEIGIELDRSKSEGKGDLPTDYLKSGALDTIEKFSKPGDAVILLQKDLEQRTNELDASRKTMREGRKEAGLDELHRLEWGVNLSRWRETLAKAATEEATARKNGTTRSKGDLVVAMEIGDGESFGFKVLCPNCSEENNVGGNEDNDSEPAKCACGLAAFSARSYDNEPAAIEAMKAVGLYGGQVLHVTTTEVSDEVGKSLDERYGKTEKDREHYDHHFYLAAAWTDPNR